MRICKDGRIWGQNNKEAGNHLGIFTGRKGYTKRGVKGSNNPMYGRKHTLESKHKISNAMKGENNPSWKGDGSFKQARIRYQIEYKIWRNAVLVRDNWTCQECGQQGGRLIAHHIKSFTRYPELRLAIDNGKTLCLKCHKLTHNFGGGNKGENKK